MVKNDRQGMGLIWIFWSILALMRGSEFLTSWGYENQWNFLFDTVLSVTLAVLFFVQARRWKPMNYRRQMAAAWGFSAHVPLAQPHPLPNVGALPLPFVIKLNPSWTKVLLPLVALAVWLIYTEMYDYRVHGEHITNLQDPFVWIFVIPPHACGGCHHSPLAVASTNRSYL